MKVFTLMIGMITLVATLLKLPAQEVMIEGCYSMSEKITSFSSEKTELKQSYFILSETPRGILGEGMIWGANFHICSIGSPIEGSEGPLSMSFVEDKLVYRYDEPEYDINCELALTIEGNKMTIHDSNGHCSNYVFYCGAHAQLDGIELSRSNVTCPKAGIY